jgi:GMP synthase-like glutamine amidotransferase
MRVLVVNNNTLHLLNLVSALKGHDIEIRDYKPGLDFSCSDKDLIILTGGGGEGLEIHDEHKPGKLWYEDQMNFVRTCQKPIIGICMGFEVIARAFGSTVEKLPEGLEESIEFGTTGLGQEIFSINRLRQFEAHDWCVPQAPQGFESLAESRTGVEIIMHKTRPLLATQFHPEKPGTLKLSQLINAFPRLAPS